MQRLQDQSLTVVFPVIAAGSALIVALALLWLAATSSDYLQTQRERDYGESIARQVADAVMDPLQRGDLLSVRASLQRFTSADLVGRIEIRDIEDMPMAAAGDVTTPGLPSYRAAIRIGGDRAGEVFVTIDDAKASESQFRFIFSLLALAAALSLLVFMGTRALALRFATRLDNLRSTITLPAAQIEYSNDNELSRLEATVEQLPLEMLRGHASVPAAATEFQPGALIFVHLASLVRYVDTLGESNLHRYSRRLQQILQAAAACYRGELNVSRPFGVIISFSPQENAGSEALRAASCARLIALIAQGLEARTNLSLDMALAIGNCEQVSNESDDMYPELYKEGAVDELRERCLQSQEFPSVVIESALLSDGQLSDGAKADALPETENAFSTLIALSEEQESLLAHQASTIVDRIKPADS